jgi:hypothetical protein
MNPVTDRLDHARIAAGLNLKSGPTRINKKMPHPDPPKAENPKEFTPKALSFFRDYARKKWPLQGSNSAVYWFQVSGFGCQGTEVLSPDT